MRWVVASAVMGSSLQNMERVPMAALHTQQLESSLSRLTSGLSRHATDLRTAVDLLGHGTVILRIRVLE